MRSFSIRPAVVVVASLTLIAAACRPPRDTSDKSRACAHFDEVRELYCQDHLEFGVLPEDAIPGFQPKATEGLSERYLRGQYSNEERKCQSNTTETELGPSDSGVITLVQFTDGASIGKIEHVDAGARIWGKHNYDTKLTTFFIPLVGPKGERLTGVYRRESPGARSPLRAVAPPMPRVTAQRVAFRDWDKNHVGDVALFVPAVIDDGAPLVWPIDYTGNLVKPEGVIGALPLGNGVFSGFLVRWRGSKGTGWSYSGDYELKRVDAGPAYKNWAVKSVPLGDILIGQRFDGQCDAEVYRGRINIGGGSDPNWGKNPKPTCDYALEAKKAQMLEWSRGNDRAAEVAKAAEAAKPENAYARLVDVSVSDACKVAEKIDTTTFQAMVVARIRAGKALDTEITCAIERGGYAAELTLLRVEAEKRAKERATAEAAARADMGTETVIHSYPTSSGSTMPNNDAYNKAVHDYTYGSGKASSCPFQDRSLCK